LVKFWHAVAFLRTEHLIEVAKAADEGGYDALALSDHIFYADEFSSRYPYSEDGHPFWKPATDWPDPWVTFGALAAVTQRIRLASNVYIAPARDLFTVAKLVSTAAVLSADRVVLGLGAGWCADEFAQTGQDFATRGRRLDEMIGALRTLWAGGMVEWHQQYYDFGPLRIAPVPDKPVPIHIGGDSEPALRRAAQLGDGWIGNRLYTPDEADAVLARLRRHREEAGRLDVDFEITMALAVAPEPGVYRRYEDQGVTGVLCAPWMAPPENGHRYASKLQARIAAIEDFAEQVVQRV
jgi:probable F420-dependent oxidoreductase